MPKAKNSPNTQKRPIGKKSPNRQKIRPRGKKFAQSGRPGESDKTMVHSCRLFFQYKLYV
jgi:hypothetical protein